MFARRRGERYKKASSAFLLNLMYRCRLAARWAIHHSRDPTLSRSNLALYHAQKMFRYMTYSLFVVVGIGQRARPCSSKLCVTADTPKNAHL